MVAVANGLAVGGQGKGWSVVGLELIKGPSAHHAACGRGGKAENWPPEEYLRQVLAEEVMGVDQARRAAPIRIRSTMPKTMATPAIDRLMHHAHLIVATGESFRFTEAKNGDGVAPLID